MRIFIPEPVFVVNLVVIPDPGAVIPDPALFRPSIPDTIYLVTTLLYSSEHFTAILLQ